MQRAPLLVELYLAVWGVLAIPIVFAALVFLVPGLYPLIGSALLAIVAVDLAYLWLLAKPDRRAWTFGVTIHLLLIPVSAYYVKAGPVGLALPALVLNVLSVLVLVAYRRVWLGEQVQEAAA
ncbi:MAG: hypothetical protein HY702_03370 [Gemmatimonadetes bacterium]|nr:hypothetical protein [Gemmatimonadota bacterium]